VEPVGQGDGAVPGVLELGNLVLVHPDVDTVGAQCLDRLEPAMGAT